MANKKSIYTNLSIVIASCLAIGIGSALPVSAFAAAAPAEPTVSKCITTETKNLHATYTARMAKDIAPYSENEKMVKAIAAYRAGLDVAWEAMNEVHCGYGYPGYASSKKSYTKTIERTRTAFLTAAKGQLKNTKVAAVAVDAKKAETTKTVAKTEAAQKKATSSIKRLIPRGLHKGMRSADVLELQKTLLTYFRQNIDTTDNATGYFGPMTHELVIRFQLEKKLIATRNSPGAGLVGPKTSSAINDLDE
ncbi:MAG: peptidoglycan-binding protein [Patescibacteria group bacterium]|nr:peptidoglycan-binding protein [Patescibacteria group bacterium]